MESQSESGHHDSVSGSEQSCSRHLHHALFLRRSVCNSRLARTYRSANSSRFRADAESQSCRRQFSCKYRRYLVGSQTSPGYATERLACSRRKQRYHIRDNNGRRRSGGQSHRGWLQLFPLLQLPVKLRGRKESVIDHSRAILRTETWYLLPRSWQKMSRDAPIFARDATSFAAVVAKDAA